MSASRRHRGFSLLETMIALAIMAVSVTAALTALISASRSAREGQYRQFKTALAEAAGARFKLMDKGTAAGLLAPLVPAVAPSLIAPIGGWPVDPTPLTVTPGGIDPSTGAYFTVDAQGQIAALAVAGGTPCNSATILAAAKASCQTANGTSCTAFCREVLVLAGLPGAQCGVAKGTVNSAGRSIDCTYWAGTGGVTATLAPGAVAYSLYVRVFRIVDPPDPIQQQQEAVQRSEVFVQ